MSDKIKCACNKKPCAGICREKNLYRPRKHLDRCPAAYDDHEPKNKEWTRANARKVRA